MIAAASVLAAALLAPASPSTFAPGIQGEPACLAETAQPGHSYDLTVTIANRGSDSGSLKVAVVPDAEPPASSLRQVPASWASFAGTPASIGSQQQIPVIMTLTIPPGAAPGPYWSHIEVSPAAAAQGQAVLGSAATTGLVLTVAPSATPPPPCDALAVASSTGKFPPWPTAAFATSSWAQVFARDRSGPVTPDGGPTASTRAVPPAARAVTAAYKIPKNVPPNWPGWAAIIVVGYFVLRWLAGILGFRR